MTLKELIQNIDRIKELQDSGVTPQKGGYGESLELYCLLAMEIKEVEYGDD